MDGALRSSVKFEEKDGKLKRVIKQAAIINIKKTKMWRHLKHFLWIFGI